MSIPFSNTHLRIPRGFGNLLEGLAREVLRKQPADIPAFAAQYFSELLRNRNESGVDPAEWGAKLEDRFYNSHVFKDIQGNAKDIVRKEEAAVKIQSTYRGFMARQKMKHKKDATLTETSLETDLESRDVDSARVFYDQMTPEDLSTLSDSEPSKVTGGETEIDTTDVRKYSENLEKEVHLEQSKTADIDICGTELHPKTESRVTTEAANLDICATELQEESREAKYEGTANADICGTELGMAEETTIDLLKEDEGMTHGEEIKVIEEEKEEHIEEEGTIVGDDQTTVVEIPDSEISGDIPVEVEAEADTLGSESSRVVIVQEEQQSEQLKYFREGQEEAQEAEGKTEVKDEDYPEETAKTLEEGFPETVVKQAISKSSDHAMAKDEDSFQLEQQVPFEEGVTDMISEGVTEEEKHSTEDILEQQTEEGPINESDIPETEPDVKKIVSENKDLVGATDASYSQENEDEPAQASNAVEEDDTTLQLKLQREKMMQPHLNSDN
nr:PREDICTED: neurofilament medium polypeptide-like isoform X2 [Latimeria chalumnae]|eukprot:XP_014341141.1 PREDICTED: neurofilament medium polypeptide-like isoform X2 [Latimeria chalumnae]